MNQIFRRFSLPIMFLESSYLAQICTKKIHDDAVIDWPVGLQYVSLEFSTTLSLMAGSCIAEKIATDISYYGLRDGSLMVICTDILVKIMGEMLTFWRSYIDGGQIKLYQVLVVALTLILSSYTATTLNMAFDSIHLSSTETEKYRTIKPFRHQDMPLKLMIPLKWLPQGTLPLLFSGFMLKIFAKIIGTVACPKTSLNYTAINIASAILVGIVVALFQSTMYLGYNTADMQKHMENTRTRILGKRPGFETFKELNGRIKKSNLKGGISLGLTSSIAKALDIWLFYETNLRLSTSSMIIIASLVSKASRQLKALDRKPKFQEHIINFKT
eukprot:gnl/TRDRNA2_/TRDRNA2_176551_c0_seq14.p1 gnl/TRDRNA2_/TRDRNA2_176551_c0~~gnl/TRDRNA2_/TRDRNA2_176551_c0_seq14.p1  ORF type:complete len:329 (-),score=-19.79 gnl/TRDRNA2_/TRDRNA2_176551_c0_seq14:343-1329(-)